MVSQKDLLADIAEKLPHSDKKRQIFSKINKDFFLNKNKKFLTQLIKDSLTVNDFKYAQKACLHLKYDQEIVKELFENYQKQIKENEIDLMIARYLLLLIATNKTADSYNCYLHFNNYLKDSLFNDFFKYLYKAFQLKNKDIFIKLEQSFQNTLKRDPQFEKYLGLIGKGYFQIQSNNSFDLMSMVGNMFS